MQICSIKGCDSPVKASRGWCWKHYNKWRRHGDPTGRFVQPPCSVVSCDRPSRSGGMCDMHYRRVQKFGDPTVRLTMPSGICSTVGCSRQTFGRGLCQKHHYALWIEAGGRTKKAAAQARRRARESAPSATCDPTLSWAALWNAGLRRCYLCDVECDPSDFKWIINQGGRQQKICGPLHPSLDHIIPLHKNGEHTAGNTALACLACNRKKWAKVGNETKHNKARQA